MTRNTLYVLLLTALSVSAYAIPSQWTVANGGNGHWYEAVLVTSGITWDNANTSAVAAGGYLVSITSSAENQFAFSLVSDNASYWYFAPESLHMEGVWLGGMQPIGSPEPTGGWRWTSTEPWNYTNWGSEEPSNGAYIEDRLQFFGYDSQPMSYWNDYADSGLVRYGSTTVLPYGYIVEWNQNPIPEPSSILALLSGVVGTAGLALRRKQSRKRWYHSIC